jgi:mannosyltransferase
MTILALGLWGLSRGSTMGNDEVATRWAALLSLRQLGHLLSHVDAVHGTYYLLMHAWMAVGTSPAVMRVPSVVGMAGAAAIVVLIGWRVSGSRWTGLLAGLIMALTPVISFFAQTARSYALVFACVVGATLVLLRALAAEAAAERGWAVARWWLAYGALLAVGGYLNELSLTVLAAHAVTVLLARYGRRSVAHWAGAAAAGAVLATPLVVLSARENQAVDWITRPGFHDVLILFRDYFGPTNWVAVLVFGCAVVGLLPPRTWRPGWRLGQAHREPDEADGQAAVPWWRSGGVSLPSVAAPLLILPGSLLMLESLVAEPLYVDRYVLFGEAGAALLAAGGVVRLGRWLGQAGRRRAWLSQAGRRRALLAAPAALLCVFALVFQLGPQRHDRTPQSRQYDFGDPAFYVGAHAKPGDGVLFFSLFFRKTRLGYPRDFRDVRDFAQAVSPAQAGNYDGRDQPVAQVRQLMLGYRRIWVIGRSPYAALTAPPVQAESAALRRNFTLAAERQFHGMTVTLWLRDRPDAADRR